MITPVPTPESIIETEEESESEWENDKEDKADKNLDNYYQVTIIMFLFLLHTFYFIIPRLNMRRKSYKLNQKKKL